MDVVYEKKKMWNSNQQNRIQRKGLALHQKNGK
jgi:hypothetical protein